MNYLVTFILLISMCLFLLIELQIMGTNYISKYLIQLFRESYFWEIIISGDLPSLSYTANIISHIYKWDRLNKIVKWLGRNRIIIHNSAIFIILQWSMNILYRKISLENNLDYSILLLFYSPFVNALTFSQMRWDTDFSWGC